MNKKVFLKKVPILFLILIAFYLTFLLSPIFLNQVKGTFTYHSVPNEYVKLDSFLNNQSPFFRTLWIPSYQRFGLNSYSHPALDATAFFNSSKISSLLRNKNIEKLLQEASVKYIIVPYDSEGEIFLQDRKYKSQLYTQTIQQISEIPYLTKLSGFNKIAIFEVPNYKEHFFFLNKNSSLSFLFINPVSYQVKLKNVTKGEKLIFSEGYDSSWELQKGNKRIDSQPFNKYFNSFILPENGSYTVDIKYSSQRWIFIGLVISLSILAICFISLLISYKWFPNKKSGKIGQ